MNPLSQHYARCNSGDPADKLRDLELFPHMLDLELTSACNFRCLMCPTGNRTLTRSTTFMEVSTYYRIMREVGEHGTAIRFIGWGEPTMHPSLVEFVNMAHDRGLVTHLNTNGSKLTPKLIGDLIIAGLSSIKFSFQGVGRATFLEMRQIDFFEELLQVIVDFKEIRGNSKRPWISVSTSTTDENAAAIAMFRRRVEPVVDELSIGKTTWDFFDANLVEKPAERRRIQELAEIPTEKRHPVPCPEVYDKLSIHADGSMVVCCNDFDGVTDLGKVGAVTIQEAWNHPELEAYRERLARRKYEGPLCSVCWDYMDLTTGA